jgi:hypothetical protein
MPKLANTSWLHLPEIVTAGFIGFAFASVTFMWRHLDAWLLMMDTGNALETAGSAASVGLFATAMGRLCFPKATPGPLLLGWAVASAGALIPPLVFTSGAWFSDSALGWAVAVVMMGVTSILALLTFLCFLITLVKTAGGVVKWLPRLSDRAQVYGLMAAGIAILIVGAVSPLLSARLAELQDTLVNGAPHLILPGVWLASVAVVFVLGRTAATEA